MPEQYANAAGAPLLCAGLIGYRSYTLTGDNVKHLGIYGFGAAWAGDSTQPSPHPLDASIIFAPVGSLVPLALRSADKGATIVCGGIHMSDIPSFSYDLLWEERSIRSVANLTRTDGREFLDLAPRIPIHTTTQTFPLLQANEALEALRTGRIHGAAVLVP
ncbi:MAG TPA: hypothetical protein VNW04_17365 [Puia sp.]|jgi:propanol-preferring alcohol dehydrogenase|nr:hypothetical protein [Puia sp.]